AGLAEHFDVAPGRSHRVAYLVGADSHAPVTFRGIERPEETVADEVLIHTLAGILDADDQLVVDELEIDDDAAVGGSRILGVPHQVGQDVEELLPVHAYPDRRASDLDLRNGLAVGAVGANLHQNLRYVGPAAADLTADAATQLLEHPLHPLDTGLHRLDRVIDELRPVTEPLCIRDDQLLDRK